MEYGSGLGRSHASNAKELENKLGVYLDAEWA